MFALLLSANAFAGTLSVSVTVIGPPPQPKIIDKVVIINGVPTIIRTLEY
jgi:hypothetical protein